MSDAWTEDEATILIDAALEAYRRDASDASALAIIDAVSGSTLRSKAAVRPKLRELGQALKSHGFDFLPAYTPRQTRIRVSVPIFQEVKRRAEAGELDWLHGYGDGRRSGINTWWDADPTERYWMEITDRTNLGDDLLAPKVDDRGHPYWSYNLVNQVREGDIVLHWHRNLMGSPAIVAWSRAVGVPRSTAIQWQSHASSGRKDQEVAEEPAWAMGLSDYTPFLRPVTLSDFRDMEGDLREVNEGLKERYDAPLYLPFAFSDKRPLRAAQGYLVKFPKDYLDVSELMDPVPREEELGNRPPSPRREDPSSAGTTRHVTDPRIRTAIERHAVQIAIQHYEALGYAVEDVGAFMPFDLLVSRSGDTRHVEVKGSSTSISSIELTHGEVKNAQGSVSTDLFVVEHINWSREPDGSVSTLGGQHRKYDDWVPEDAALKPTRYSYSLP